MLYRPGEKVYYLDRQGKPRRALVVSAHCDQHPAYYTIRLLRTEREVQTERERLRPRRARRPG